MSLANFFANMKRYQKNAELIFDEEEPIGVATDVVMPRRRWFRRNQASQNHFLPQTQEHQHS